MDLAMQACRQMGWRLVGAAEGINVFYTNGSETSQQEEIVVRAIDNKAYVSSRSVSEYLYDQKQNVQNILSFRTALSIHHNGYLQRRDPQIQHAPLTLLPDQKFNLQAGWGAIVPSKHYLITPMLIYFNVFILLLMVLAGLSPLHPTASSLLGWGGNFQALVLKGEYWRLFTYMFLHGGIMHLAGNVFALLYVGLYLEPMLGKLRYISAYVITGIFAGAVSMVVHGYSVGVGASGAIFGLYGVFLALLSAKYIKGAIRTTMLRSLLFFIVYNLMMGLQGNTDNAAHIGGLLSGMVIGYVFLGGLKRRDGIVKRTGLIAVMSVALVALVGGVIYLLRSLP
jgi:rhomboid protease GluP